jgi:DNA-binding SARP family transcriptional activator
MTSQLSLTLLGAFQVTHNQGALTGFNSDKTRALLAYLAVEAEQPHRREQLIGLFWPEFNEERARANLSQALHVLRKLFDGATGAHPLLLADAKQLRLNPAADLWIDVHEFTRLMMGCSDHRPQRQRHCPHCRNGAQEAMLLYKGELLTGFSLPDCPEFEQWLLVKRTELHRLAVMALAWLAEGAETQGEWSEALAYARQWATLEPLAEEAQQMLARLLMTTGQRHEALNHLAAYEQRLTTELGVTPSAALLHLQQQLMTDSPANSKPVRSPMPFVVAPAFLATKPPVPHVSTVFVGRANEVADLQQELNQVLRGAGRCVFVTGEAGFGKSALLQHFARLAQQTPTGVVILRGNCNAYTGIGDPYLPFREILATLTGEIEAHWRAGVLSQAAAMQLWALLPAAIDALVKHGPDLIGTLVPADALLMRAGEVISGEQLERVQAVVTRNAQKTTGNSPVQQQGALFSQYTAFLQQVAQQQPLVLLIDDLQWADLGTISLLFHLARTITHDRIFILGAYRPSEVALGRNAQRHPLEAVLHELQRHYGAMTVALEAADSRAFVDQLVDLEPNALPVAFRDQLWRYTAGNALFTLELLRGLQERGDLRRDDAGRWLVGATLDWERLPPRVEAVIGERIGRLSPPLQQLLMVASVEGELFTAEVAAQVQHLPRREAVHWLSHELDRQHHLVRLQSVHHLGEQPITHYRFRHILFQKYLYSQLDEAERVYYHADVGDALSSLYEKEGKRIARQLARHFQEAGRQQLAAAWLLESGQQALYLSALSETILLLTQGVDLLTSLPETVEQLALALQFHLTLAVAQTLNKGYNADEAGNAYRAAEAISRKLGKTPELAVALRGQSAYHRMGGRFANSLQLAEKLVEIVHTQDDVVLQVEAHSNIGATLYWLGEFQRAHHHFMLARTLIQQFNQQSDVYRFGQDSRVFSFTYHAKVLWMCGYPDQALQAMHDALLIARQVEHPGSIGFTLQNMTDIYLMRREIEPAARLIEELLHWATTKELYFWRNWSRHFRHWIAAESGQAEQARLEFRQIYSDDPNEWKDSFSGAFPIAIFGLVNAKVGDYATALKAIDAAFEKADRGHDHCWLAELHRLRGKFLLLQGNNPLSATASEAESCFQRAVEIARQQGAKSWELRSAMSLAQLWQKQGKSREGYALLAAIYDWFTEGFDTYDLRKAQRLLAAMRI